MKDLIALFKIPGISYKEISEKSGLTIRQLYAYRYSFKHIYDLPKPKRLSRKCTVRDFIQEAKQYYSENHTLHEVGQKFGGVTRERVRQIFQEFEIKSRPVGTSKRKYFHCEKGHPISKGEGLTTCILCASDKKADRILGKHFKTHCKYGHELIEDNLIYQKRPSGKPQRKCKICQTAALKRSYEKFKKKRNI